jgi:hypothetical protein
LLVRAKCANIKRKEKRVSHKRKWKIKEKANTLNSLLASFIGARTKHCLSIKTRSWVNWGEGITVPTRQAPRPSPRENCPATGAEDGNTKS